MSLTKSDLTKINTLFAKMDSGDFSTVANMFKMHRNNAASMATGNFSKGDSVFFINSRSGQKVSGVVEKVHFSCDPPRGRKTSACSTCARPCSAQLAARTRQLRKIS